jgi:hypothetical protein
LATFCGHLLIAVIGFFTINLIARISASSIAYQMVSLTALDDEVEYASSIFFRIIAPVIYLVIVSALAVKFQLEAILSNIWLVVPYLFLVRFTFNEFLTERSYLIRRNIFTIQVVASTALALVAYGQIIRPRISLFPNLQTLGNEVWLVIGFFLYKAVSDIPVSDDAEARRLNFIIRRHYQLKRKFSHLVEDLNLPDEVKRLVFAIMIVETYNRPRFARWIESCVVFFKPTTQGVMQVESKTWISNSDSIKIAAKKLSNLYRKILLKGNSTLGLYKETTPEEAQTLHYENRLEQLVIERTAWHYNNDKNYSELVWEIYSLIKQEEEKPIMKQRRVDRFDPYSNELDSETGQPIE